MSPTPPRVPDLVTQCGPDGLVTARRPLPRAGGVLFVKSNNRISVGIAWLILAELRVDAPELDLA